MAPRNSSSKAEKRRAWNLNWRYVASAGLISLALMSMFFAWQQVEQFLIRDPRFMLAPAAEYGDESPNLHIDGVQYANRNQILRVFQQDIGRSIYLFPLQDRRKALLRVAWVKDASISRIWPNQISVHITERKPAAFLQLPSEAISRWALIDADGIILDPPLKAPFKLPVITGMEAGEPAALRGMRVRRMSRMLDEVGTYREKVSEVDVSDLDNLKVTLKMGNRPLVLMLGDHNFHDRVQSFFDHYEEIQKRISDVRILDLRLDDRITVVGGKSE